MPETSAAQTPSTGAATAMWGVGPSSFPGVSGESSTTLHLQNGLIAGQVNAAEQRLLISNGMLMTIQAIGAQSIVSTTVYGDNNDVNTTATQTTDNSGDASTNGSIGAPDVR